MRIVTLVIIGIVLLTDATRSVTSTAEAAANTTTEAPTTAKATTATPTTSDVTTAGPTTSNATTAGPTTAGPTTAGPTTAGPTTSNATTAGPTTAGPTTAGPTTAGPTTSNATNTTTAAPVKPTTEAPVKPTTAPFSKAYQYNVTGMVHNKSEVCLRLETALKFNISYMSTRTNKTAYFPVVFVHNKKTKVSGHCGTHVNNNKSRLAMSDITIVYDDIYTVTFTYTYNGSMGDGKWFQSDVKFTYDLRMVSDVKNPNEIITVHNSTRQHAVGGDYSLTCNAQRSLGLNDTMKKQLVVMVIKDMHVQAFNVTAGGDFSSDAHCPADNSTNNIVPIAVGCALAALVLIVLIAYLIGRKRNSQAGYQSV